MLLVPLDPVEADHTVAKAAAPKDVTVNKKLDMQSEKRKSNDTTPRKSLYLYSRVFRAL